MPLFNHAFTIAFSCVSERPGDEVPATELRAALLQLLESLSDDDLEAACGLPFNSFTCTSSDPGVLKSVLPEDFDWLTSSKSRDQQC